MLFALRSLVVSSLFLILSGCATFFTTPSTLVDGLGGYYDEEGRIATTEFDERVRALFPIGSSVVSMREELQREGFKLGDTRSNDYMLERQHVGEEVARRPGTRFVLCNEAAYVFWRTDAQERLLAVRGQYAIGPCV